MDVHSPAGLQASFPPHEDCSEIRPEASASVGQSLRQTCLSSAEFCAYQESPDDPPEAEPLTARPAQSDPELSPRALFEWRQLLLEAS